MAPTASPTPVATPTPSDGLPHPANPLAPGASLVPLATLPEEAITDEEAITLAFARFGAYANDYREKYPPVAVSATYSSPATSGGPAADERPVWVVTFPWGTGPSGPAVLGGTPRPAGAYKVETVVIIDAMTGIELTSWHHSWFLPASPTAGGVPGSVGPEVMPGTDVVRAPTAGPTPLPMPTATPWTAPTRQSSR